MAMNILVNLRMLTAAETHFREDPPTELRPMGAQKAITGTERKLNVGSSDLAFGWEEGM